MRSATLKCAALATALLFVLGTIASDAAEARRGGGSHHGGRFYGARSGPFIAIANCYWVRGHYGRYRICN